VAVFARGEKADQARAAGADIVGAEDLMQEIQGGKIDFDRCIATPDLMPVVGRLGKILGPRNLMPEPQDRHRDARRGRGRARGQGRAGAVQGREGGRRACRRRQGLLRGRQLVENIRAFVDAVSRAKPTGAKGSYMKKVSIASTMGPGVSVDLASATGNA
jgi:large subunit ribosomal protein L1